MHTIKSTNTHTINSTNTQSRVIQVLITITFKNIVNIETYKHWFKIYYAQDCKYTNKCDQ